MQFRSRLLAAGAYESEITKGLNLLKVIDLPQAAGAIALGNLNPQTQEFSLP